MRKGKVTNRLHHNWSNLWQKQAGPTYHVGEDDLLVLDVADCSRELQNLCGQFHNERRAQPAEHHQLRAQHPEGERWAELRPRARRSSPNRGGAGSTQPLAQWL